MATNRFYRGYDRYKKDFVRMTQGRGASVHEDGDLYRNRMLNIINGPVQLFIKRVWINRGLITLVSRDGSSTNYPISLLREHVWFQEGLSVMHRMFIPQSAKLLQEYWGLADWEIKNIIAGKKRIEDI